ncbi:TIR domain-containing protein [Amycolatopsis sp. NPDC003865]
MVSCDILGHSAANGSDQIRRVDAINAIVAAAICRLAPGRIIWSSGGDGGHVIFFGDDWQQDAVRLMRRLYRWSRAEGVVLRVTGHVGEVTTSAGADGRTQAVGPGINFAGWLIRKATGSGIVVSDSFRRGVGSSPVAAEVTFHGERLQVDRSSTRQLLHLMSLDGVRSEWAGPEPDDYESLNVSLDEGNGWEALYFAKRISQINAKDPGIDRALERISRILKSGTTGNGSFLEPLRSDELTEMLKLGHLVERTPGDVICRVDDPGDSLFVILHGEVGVYNLEGKGFGGSAEPKHTHHAGEVVGELATALKRNRTADLVAMTDVALLSFIGEEVSEKLKSVDTPAGREAALQWDLFLRSRVLEHTVQVAPYLLGPSRQGPLGLPDARRHSRVSAEETWEQTVRDLVKHAELITVDDGELSLEIDQVTRKVGQKSADEGLFVLVSGRVRSPSPAGAVLFETQCPLLWVNLPKLFVEEPRTYTRVKEPVKVLWISASGIGQLSLEQRTELQRSLQNTVGGVPSEYEYDVYLCHSSEDKAVVIRIKDRLWREYGIRSWYDDVELRPGDVTRKKIEKGLRASRFLLLCASASLKSSEWANREIDSVLHLDVKRRDGAAKVLVLKLYEHETNDEAIPVVLRGIKRQHLERVGDFERLAAHILAAGRRGRGEDSS